MSEQRDRFFGGLLWASILLFIVSVVMQVYFADTRPLKPSTDQRLRRVEKDLLELQIMHAEELLRIRKETFNEPTLVRMKVTGFTLHPDECGKPVGHKDYGRTASGKVISDSHRMSVVAVDNKLFRFGTKFKIHLPDGSTIVAEAVDTGGAVVGHHLDLFFGEGHRQGDALRWGEKYLAVEVLSWP